MSEVDSQNQIVCAITISEGEDRKHLYCQWHVNELTGPHYVTEQK